MTDQELLQAIGQVVEAKMEPMRQDIRILKEDVQILKQDVQNLQKNYVRMEAKMDNLRGKVTDIRIYMDTDLHRTLNLLLEGQQALWDRFVPQEKYDALNDRTQVLELAIKRHSKEIRELQLA